MSNQILVPSLGESITEATVSKWLKQVGENVDTDEPLVMCEVNGNIDGANIGEPAIDFELDYVANGNGSFTLSDQLGKIVVLAFFAPN